MRCHNCFLDQNKFAADDDNKIHDSIDVHSHVHVLDGVHDVDPQHEVGNEAKENQHCHMDSSQPSPMGSFPENWVPANV